MIQPATDNDPSRFTRAIVRCPGHNLGLGLTTANLGAPDHDLAERQFRRYVRALETCGLVVELLDPLPDFPDAHFVEDTAVVTRDVAVLARPGAIVRRGESVAMEPILAAHRPVRHIESPGTLDGGDVLLVGTHALIGISDRTNEAGAQQLGEILGEHGHTWQTVPVAAGLHFKSSVNLVDEKTLLLTAGFARDQALAGYAQIVVPDHESYACNVLLLNGRLLIPSGYAETRRRLERLGREIIELDTSEFRKMDGGLTCLSLRF